MAKYLDVMRILLLGVTYKGSPVAGFHHRVGRTESLRSSGIPTDGQISQFEQAAEIGLQAKRNHLAWPFSF